MSNCFLLIAFVGIIYFAGNLFQALKNKPNHLLNKHLIKVFILFCLLVFGVELLHIFNFISNNFAFNSVFENSAINQPLIYKIVASYSGQGASFLLWLFFLSLIGLLVLKQTQSNTNPKFFHLLQAIFIIFPIILSLILNWNNPFEKTLNIHTALRQVPIDGFGLKFILQNHFNLFHPPLLFIGFSLLYIPYVFSLTSLISKKYLPEKNNLEQENFDEKNEKTNFHWLNFALKYNNCGLFFLSAGILFGSFWAYYSFGWGGFWSWDPIENAALLPMLFSISLLHSGLIFKKNGGMLKTCFLLSLLTFPTILLCTFLARSGVILASSPHSYAGMQSETHQIIFSFLLLILFVSLAIYLFRLSSIFGQYKPIQLSKSISPSLIISFGIIALLCISFVVFVGTCLPIFAPFVKLNPVIITPSFYTSWTMPLAMIMLLCIGIADFLDENKNNFTKFSNKILPAFVASTVTMIFIFYCGINRIEYLLLTFFCAFAFFSQTQNYIIFCIKNRIFYFRNLGKILSHLGVCIFIFSAMLFGNFDEEFTVDLVENQAVEISSYKIIFRQMEITNTLESIKYSALIEVFDAENNFVQLSPYFMISNKRPNAIPAMFPAAKRIGIKDIYIEPINYFIDATVQPYHQNSDTPKLRINFFIKPFIIFVWLGGIMLVLGIFLSLFFDNYKD